jgi:hypothetical protein
LALCQIFVKEVGILNLGAGAGCGFGIGWGFGGEAISVFFLWVRHTLLLLSSVILLPF